MNRTPLLLLGGHDPTGQAGLARDITVCVEERVQPCPVATAVTVQTSHALDEPGTIEARHVLRQAGAALAEHGPKWAKVGALASAEQVEAVGHLVRSRGLHLVLDPVLETTSGGRFLDDDGVHALRGLVAETVLVAPNRAEALWLTGREDPEHAARTLVRMGAGAALVTQGGRGADILFDGIRVHRLDARKVPGRHRGTGCRLTTRIACHLARGLGVLEAVRLARNTLRAELESDAQEQTLSGRRLIHFRDLEAWFPRILATIRFEDVPEVGMNIAYALPGARDPRVEVLGLAGRITIAGLGTAVAGRLRYGGPHHTGRIAVVLQEHDPTARIVMNHRFDETYLDNARAAGLTDAGFRREDEPEDAPSSMEWGVRTAIHQSGGVPDLIWDRGGVGKEAMIRIIADSPGRLVAKLRAMHGADADLHVVRGTPPQAHRVQGEGKG